MSEVRKIATREGYGKALKELGAEYPNLVVLDADLAAATKTAVFMKAYPERHINCGIAEANMTGIAAGLATCGKIPFMSSFAMFATGRNYEQIRNSIGYPHLNVKIGASHAGITVGEDGASHQCNEDIALMRTIPGMVIMSPADVIEAEAATRAAAEYEGPVYLRFGRAACPVIDDIIAVGRANNSLNDENAVAGQREEPTFAMGKGRILRSGEDLTIIATGICVASALEAAMLLAEEGIGAEVINICTIKPLDEELVKSSARKTGRVVTAEEHSIIGGLGSAVCEALSEEAIAPVYRIGIRDVFGQSGSAEELLVLYRLDTQGIYQQIKEFIGR